MSMEAMSGDIFSILRKFQSATMGGTYNNTNAPRDMPPAEKVEANTDAARAMSDPTRYGATGADAGTGLIPQGPQGAPPQPVARRVVPAGRPPAVAPPVAARPDPTATGAVQSPPRQPPPAPTDGSRATALVNAPDGPAATGAMPQAGGGGAGGEFDFIYNNPIYKFQLMEQRRKYAENERQQAMDNIVGGLGGILGYATGNQSLQKSGAALGGRPDISEHPTLTFDMLKDLQAQKLSAENMASMRGVADQLVKENPGMSRAAIEAVLLSKSEEFAKLGIELSSPKARADLMKTLTETAKAEQGLAGVGANDPDVIAQTTKDLGMEPTPENLKKVANMSITERQDMLSKVLTAREQGKSAEVVKLHGKTIEAADETIRTAHKNISERANRRTLLDQEILAGYPGAGTEMKIRQFLTGGADEKAARTAQYLTLSANEALTLGEKMKGSFSDRDLAFLKSAVAGDLSLNRETMQRVLALRDLADRKQLSEAIEHRSTARGAVGMPDVGDDRVGPLQQHELKVVNADYLADALKTDGGRKYFETLYGKGHAGEMIQRAGEIASAKMIPEDYQYAATMPLEQLKAERAELEAALERAHPGGDTKGTIDLIIAMREGKK